MNSRLAIEGFEGRPVFYGAGIKPVLIRRLSTGMYAIRRPSGREVSILRFGDE